MSLLLIFAIIAITLALVFYSFGVWGEKLSGGLKAWNLCLFWSGLVFDTTGTVLMAVISESTKFNLHTLTGSLAIVLMLFHAVWATMVIVKKNEKMKSKFHKFSIVVWAIWLIPYFTGMFLNIL